MLIGHVLIALQNLRRPGLIERAWWQVTSDERAIIDSWQQQGMLLTSPPGANDDWYWMYASVLPADNTLLKVPLKCASQRKGVRGGG